MQVIAAPGLQEKADDQSIRTIPLEAARGVIHDRNGQALAVSQIMATVYANPKQIEDAAAVAGQLAPILGVPEDRAAREAQRRLWVQVSGPEDRTVDGRGDRGAGYRRDRRLL